ILKMDNLLVSSIVSKYNQENQWDNKDAFQAAKEVLSSVVNSKIKAIDNSEMEEYCTNQMKHARTYCFCGNHASFREILNGGF
ncbi:MAG: hypothetical protein KDK36_20200, partial [Leptospiraceae bacterium]|nr:hypothetical protein [Leptospiraceae bacterium]